MDFTLTTYKELLKTLKSAGYTFQTFEQFLQHPAEGKTIVLRHDVDELAVNALAMARLEHDLGIAASYFFRIVKQSNNPTIIRQIVQLGHEIGYHYEDLNLNNGDVGKAVEEFERNLSYFRTYYPVKTVAMHGSSSCKYDNRDLWKVRQLSDYGLIGEPYISIDFTKVYYLSDTGYAWDGGKYAVRDVVENYFGLSFHSTRQVIAAIQNGVFPQHCMILAHTLWTDSIPRWMGLHLREFLRNRVKHWSRSNAFVQKIYSKLVRLYWK